MQRTLATFGALLTAPLAASALAGGVAIEVSAPSLVPLDLVENTDFTFTDGKIHVTWQAAGGRDYTYKIEAVDGPTVVSGLQINNVPSTSSVTVNFVTGATGIELEFVDHLRKG